MKATKTKEPSSALFTERSGAFSYRFFLSLTLFALACVLLGIFNAPVVAFLEKVAGGLI